MPSRWPNGHGRRMVQTGNLRERRCEAISAGRRKRYGAHALIRPNRTVGIKVGMRTGYTRLVNGYVDTALVEPVDSADYPMIRVEETTAYSCTHA